MADEAKVSAAKATKTASEVEELRERKREVESALKSLQSDYDQGCNSIDILNLRLELRHKLRQGLRTRLGRCRIGRRLRHGLRPSKMSIELHPWAPVTLDLSTHAL